MGRKNYIDLFQYAEKSPEKIAKEFAELPPSVKAQLKNPRTASAMTEVAGGDMFLVHQMARTVDKLMGPGRDLFTLLLAKYPELLNFHEAFFVVIEKASRLKNKSNLGAAEIKSLAIRAQWFDLKRKLLRKIEDDIEELLSGVPSKTITSTAKNATNVVETQLPKLSAKELIAEIEREFKFFEQQMGNYGAALAARRANLLSSRQLAKRTEAILKKYSEIGFISPRIKKLAEFGQPKELSKKLGKDVCQDLKGIPGLDQLDDESRMFAEALGALAQSWSKTKQRRILQKVLAKEEKFLKKPDLKKLEGVKDQLRGLLPEEIGTQLGVLQSIFSKWAFELSSYIKPEIWKNLEIEWIPGAVREIGTDLLPELGDGMMVLRWKGEEVIGKVPKAPSHADAVLIGLGEFKAGLSQKLLEQLAKGAEKRLGVQVAFFDGDGEIRTLNLMLFPEEWLKIPEKDMPAAWHQLPEKLKEPIDEALKRQAATQKVIRRDVQSPVFVHGRPEGFTPEMKEQFLKNIEEKFGGGKEIHYFDLPFTRATNEKFVDLVLKHGLAILANAKKPIK